MLTVPMQADADSRYPSESGGVSFERDRGLGVAERNIRGESGVGRICVLTYVVQNRTYARIYLDI